MIAEIKRLFGNEEVLTVNFTINGDEDCIDANILDRFEEVIRGLLTTMDSPPPEAYLEKLLCMIKLLITDDTKVTPELLGELQCHS